MQIIRQGDVLLQYVGPIQDEHKNFIANQERVVLAHGEATGHAHAIYDKGVAHLTEDDTLMIFSQTTLLHEEHNPVGLKPGIYRKYIQQEYTPDGGRDVID